MLAFAHIVRYCSRCDAFTTMTRATRKIEHCAMLTQGVSGAMSDERTTFLLTSFFKL